MLFKPRKKWYRYFVSYQAERTNDGEIETITRNSEFKTSRPIDCLNDIYKIQAFYDKQYSNVGHSIVLSYQLMNIEIENHGNCYCTVIDID